MMKELAAGAGGSQSLIVQGEFCQALLGSEGLQRLGALMAVDREGVLRGVVTLDQLRRALQGPAVAGRPGA